MAAQGDRPLHNNSAAAAKEVFVETDPGVGEFKYRWPRPGLTVDVVLVAAPGVAPAVAQSDRMRRLCRQAAAAELLHVADMMDAEPMGLQFGLLPTAEPSGSFKILRSRDRATLAVNPFRSDAAPAGGVGVAMITGADEAIAAHQRVAEALWREAVKGPTAAAAVRELVKAARAD